MSPLPWARALAALVLLSARRVCCCSCGPDRHRPSLHRPSRPPRVKFLTRFPPLGMIRGRTS